MTRRRPSCKQEGDKAVLSANVMQTMHHSRMAGFPREWETKNNLSDESMMLVTSVLIGGMLGDGNGVGDDGGPLYMMTSSSTASGLRYVNRSLSLSHGKGLNSLFSLDSGGKWKSL